MCSSDFFSLVLRTMILLQSSARGSNGAYVDEVAAQFVSEKIVMIDVIGY